MTNYDCNRKLIKYLYPCEELASNETSEFLEPYEEDVLYQLENKFENEISCHGFVRFDDQGEAYFDVYIIDPASKVEWIRYSIHKGKRLPEEEEESFLKYVTNKYVRVDEKYFDRFIMEASEYIGGYSLGRYAPRAELLQYIYFSYHKSGPKELLYKAGLDSIANSFDLVNDVNLLADNITDIFNGLNIRLLRMLNTPYNVKYLYSKTQRDSLKKIYDKYGSYMKRPYLEESEIIYLMWCLDGITQYDREIYNFITYLDITEEVDYMQYLELRKRIGSPKRYPKVFSNADDMYCAIEELENIGDIVDNEHYYDTEIHNLAMERINRYVVSDDEYEVVIPTCVHHIIEEGNNIQRNCLIRYIPEYALGFTDLVFFVSKKNRNVHLTMRVVKEVVMEVRGKFNRKLTSDEKAFVERYCDFVQLRCSEME